MTRQATKQGVDAIDKGLSNGRPVIVGVNWGGGTGGNRNTATQHFVTIVDSGTDQKGKFYRFYDPGTQWQSKGTSPENRLYLNSDYSLSGTSAYNKDSKYYIVTEVRPQQ